MNDDIPSPSASQMPIRTQHHLYQYWRRLLGEPGFGERLLWCSFLDSGCLPTPVLSQISDLPTYPDDLFLRNLMSVVGTVLSEEVPGGSVALLLSRPGPGYITDSDRAWGRGLMESADRAKLPIRPLHLATNDELRLLTYDDLLPRTAS